MRKSSACSHNSSSSSICSMQRSAGQNGHRDANSVSKHDFGNKILVTDHVQKTGKYINQYLKVAMIGKGQHGKVYKCSVAPEHSFIVAIKSCKRNNPKEEKMAKLRQQNQAIPRTTEGKTSVVDRVENAEKKVKREIAIMKKCHHGQIVRLYEVIDDRMSKSIYMVMEYMGGGEVKWHDLDDRPVLKVNQTRRICRDVVLGLEYLHYQGIIHRDIKPANLLWSEDRQSVKITDFGVAHFSYAQRLASAGLQDDDPEEVHLHDESSLTRTAGTPTFLAPEVVYDMGSAVGEELVEVESPVDAAAKAEPSRSPQLTSPTSGSSLANSERPSERPPITKAIDVWALGVTMYCLLFGQPPWHGINEFQLYGKLRFMDFEVPETMGSDKIPTGGRQHASDDTTEGGVVINLLSRLLEKDQRKRITLDDVKRLPWILQDIPNPEKWLQETSPSRHDMVSVSAEEASVAMSEVKFRYPAFTNRLMQFFRRKKHRDNDEPSTSRENPVVATRRAKSVSATDKSRRDSSRSKRLSKGKEKAAQPGPSKRPEERSGHGWAVVANTGDKLIPLESSGSLHARLSRKSSGTTPDLNRQASQISQTDKSLRERHHSGASFYKSFNILRWTHSGRSSGPDENFSQTIANQNHGRYSEEHINQQNKRTSEPSLSAVQRSSSWEPSNTYDEHDDMYGSDFESDYDGSVLGDEQMMVGAGGVLSRVVSRNSTEGGLLHDSSCGRQLALHAIQSDRLMSASDAPVVANPALHELRQSRSHTISPLAQDSEEETSVFDDDDENYDDDRVYGVGSQTLIPDESEEEDDDDEFSEDEGQRIEIRRRRPSESLARSTSQHAAITNDNQ